MVLPFLVGGSSPTGEALLALYREQLDIENTIPLVNLSSSRQTLPEC